MQQLADTLSTILGRPVIDKTGYTGAFNVQIEYSLEGTIFRPAGPGPGGEGVPAADTSKPSIFTVVREQLGLNLESQKGPADILVVDHAEKPAAN